MAYAAVISLKHTVERLTNAIMNPQILISAHEELQSLEAVLKRLDRSTNSRTNRSVLNELDAEIRRGVWQLEDALESYALHHSLPPSDSLGDEGVEQEIDSFLGMAQEMREKYERELDNPLGGEQHYAASPIIDDFGGEESTMVGLWDQCKEISDELLESQSRRKIALLVGMAGIGKTFLARNVYERLINVRPSNVPHFPLTAWVSVGPTRKIEQVLVDILSQVVEDNPTTAYTGTDTHTLAHCLYKTLYRRRYLIVLDDIWNADDWGYLMNFFPEDKNDSRLLLTTRLERVPCPSDTTYIVHKMRFLSNEESWKLLKQSVLGEGYYPYELEKAGKKIAEKCDGLPLLILAVARILLGEDRTEERWNLVVENQTATFPDAYEQISEVLSSSYEYLPQYLKPCFLYMGVFPQNYEIPLSKLINLWAVEDFLEPSHSQTLEEFAIKCLKELFSKSLVMVGKNSSNDTIKYCKLHSAYWSLCVEEARKNQFLLVLNKYADVAEVYNQSQRRLSVQNNILFAIKDVLDSMAATLTVRSLLCTGEYHGYPVPIDLNLVLLKVLDALAVRFYEFPFDVLKLLQLKYLALTHNGSLPSSISQLQKLQSLIVGQHHSIKLLGNSPYLPEDIWDMQELRHLRITGSNLPCPSKGAELPNLLTLHVKGHSCTEHVFRSTRKLKKLGIKIELQPRSAEMLRCFDHISILEELESLKCVVVNPRPGSQVVAPPNPSSSFPTSLKKLSLNGLGYSWEHITAIGSLPHLQVLKLRCFAFQGPEWKTRVKEFKRLEFLLLEDIDLVHWTTAETDDDDDDENLFPRLQRLVIRHCYQIEEIPEQIEDIETLETIEIADCHHSVMLLAQDILKQKKKYANISFRAPITSSLNLPLKVEEFDDGVESDDH